MDQAQVSVPHFNLRVHLSACLHAHISDGQPSAGSGHPNTCPLLPPFSSLDFWLVVLPSISNDLHGHCYLARLYVSNLLHALLCAPSPHFPMRSYTHSNLAIGRYAGSMLGKLLARTRECGSQVTFCPPARPPAMWENRGVVGNWI
ncbi:hypothetical protein QR685DRAFT_580146 [Neurospora intermedia]|uniref:Uncharacterized protein n=1 Tax=Neurospora intermedia TaxID=5142 RepID=A0ABR3D289_NEUIN